MERESYYFLLLLIGLAICIGVFWFQFNKTITFHKPGYLMGTLVDTQTDENGEFFIENVEYLPDAGKDNYYGDFTFAGDDKYQGCTYIGNITVIPN